MSQNHLRVLVLDERPVFRVGVQHILADDPDISDVHEASTLEAADPLLSGTTFDVIVTAVETEDPVAANDRFCQLARRAGSAHIVCLGREGAPGPPRCGRFTTIPENSMSHRIREAVDSAPTEQVAHRFRCGNTSECSVAHTHQDLHAELTGQEGRVLALLAEGLSNREIGDRLGIAEKTVKNYVTRILAKLGVPSRAAAIAHLHGG